jgi:hypothetical protein
MRVWLRRNPWIWIVAFMAAVVAANLILVWIAVSHPPVAV